MGVTYLRPCLHELCLDVHKSRPQEQQRKSIFSIHDHNVNDHILIFPFRAMILLDMHFWSVGSVVLEISRSG